MKSICQDEGMPCVRTAYRWLAASTEFRRNYAIARELQAQTLADEVIEIADDESNDLARARLRVGARKWRAGTLSPVKYGSRFAAAPSDEPPPVIKVIREIVSPKKRDANGGQ